MEKIKHFFASANTNAGFVNHFDNINFKNRGFCYVLKGGSGTGKSTLLKTISAHFAQKGHEVEHFHCSSDHKSLDGIRIVSANISIVDGTAPHITEANLPEIYDKIVNVGAFISPNVAQHKNTIEQKLTLKKIEYQKIYLLFACIGKMLEVEYLNATQNANNQKIEQITKQFFAQHKFTKTKTTPKVRQLFLQAIDEKGIVDLEDKNCYKNIFEIDGTIFENQQIFDAIKQKLFSNGYDVFEFKNIFKNDLTHALYIPKKDLFIKCKDQKIKNQYFVNALIKQIATSIKTVHKSHFFVEKCYIKNMDFKKLDLLTQNLIFEIEQKIKQS